MRADGALRLSRRVRSVNARRALIERATSGLGRSGNKCQEFTSPMIDWSLVTCGCATLLVLAADENMFECRKVGQMFEQPLKSLAINDRDLDAGIVEAVLEFRPGPPGIEQSPDTAGEQSPEESGRPSR